MALLFTLLVVVCPVYIPGMNGWDVEGHSMVCSIAQATIRCMHPPQEFLLSLSPLIPPLYQSMDSLLELLSAHFGWIFSKAK